MSKKLIFSQEVQMYKDDGIPNELARARVFLKKAGDEMDKYKSSSYLPEELQSDIYRIESIIGHIMENYSKTLSDERIQVI